MVHLMVPFYVLCVIATKVHLGIDQKNNFKSSNWIRHVKQCVQEKEGKEKTRDNLIFSGRST